MSALTPLLLVLIASSLAAQTTAIPADSQAMLKQLGEFEKQEREKAEAAIQAKRKLVAAALQQQMERETKAGRLEQAVALKTKIAELTAPAAAPAPPPEVGKPDPTDLAGTVWKNGSWTYYFLKGGNVLIKTPTGEDRLKWKQEDQSVVITSSTGGEFATWRVSRSGDSVRVTSGTGEGMEPKKQAER